MQPDQQPLYPPEMAPHLRHIFEMPYPRFSDAEMKRRRTMLEGLMEAAGVDHVLLYGVNRAGNALQYFTHWPTTAEANCIVTPGQRDRMFIHYHNHINLARQIA